MTNNKNKICPICSKVMVGYPAISRKDNKTEICPECALAEALAAFETMIEKKQN